MSFTVTYSVSFTSLHYSRGAVKSFRSVPKPAPACRRTFALNLLKEKMAMHGLRGWKGTISDKMTRAAGYCKYRSKTISISGHWLNNPKFTDEHVLDTILHEIAHALVGYEAKHGPVWKAKASEIGATPKSCFKL